MLDVRKKVLLPQHAPRTAQAVQQAEGGAVQVHTRQDDVRKLPESHESRVSCSLLCYSSLILVLSSTI